MIIILLLIFRLNKLLIFYRQIMNISLTAVFQKVPGGYVAYVEELPGANTQGFTLEEARTNLEEAIQLVLKANRILSVN
jgi:predicted RNase H-like HicB family nuclease